jgi:molybdopterin converting factor small subunit
VSLNRENNTVKIILKSTFNLNEIEVETQSATLGALMSELSGNGMLTNVQFFDRGGDEVYPDCDVEVNGQSYMVLADGLNTKLNDGDKVEIILFTLAGG